MNEAILERQLSEVPSVIINATAPLGNRKAWAIYIALLQRDEGLRFNQIRDLFEAEPPEISRALKALSNAGLIARQVRSLDDVGNTEASFYVPTTLGKALIAALYRGLLPSREDEVHGDVAGPARTHCQDSPFSTGRITASAPGEAEVHVR
ncbi:MarR family winged helix-turn-helix transcriptional regulator [Methanoculleus sp.]|uniref:MarR family winged helix-turn-helix transcriptional regulator n=1 Tax=Methanoculleus sp. TaxID=90427 RepID=UPI0025D4B368|nr:MarR family winged helix-turn-helix transcriptional regulator [Methanoculleus sp.]